MRAVIYIEKQGFPVIDLEATGRNIARLRTARGLTVRDIQVFFGFSEPQAVYKWQSGKCLPTVDNLYALSCLLGVSMDEILVPSRGGSRTGFSEQQAESCCSVFYPGAGASHRAKTAIFCLFT